MEFDDLAGYFLIGMEPQILLEIPKDRKKLEWCATAFLERIVQTNSVDEYFEEFQVIRAQLESVASFMSEELSEGFFLDLFIAGLEVETMGYVEWLTPSTVVEAKDCAAYFERRRPFMRKVFPHPVSVRLVNASEDVIGMGVSSTFTVGAEDHFPGKKEQSLTKHTNYSIKVLGEEMDAIQSGKDPPHLAMLCICDKSNCLIANGNISCNILANAREFVKYGFWLGSLCELSKLVWDPGGIWKSETVLVILMWTINLHKQPKITGAQLVAILSLVMVHVLGIFTNMSCNWALFVQCFSTSACVLPVSNKHALEAVLLFKKMLTNVVPPNELTFPFILKACTASSMTQCGILVHGHVVKCVLKCDSYIQSSLICLYSSRGKDLSAAKQVFDSCHGGDTVCWNSMIDGYLKSSEIVLAMGLFDRMVCRDVISWNSMLACYVRSEKSSEALALFDEMKSLMIRPTDATIASILSAAGHLGVLEQGLCFHSYTCDHEIEMNSISGTVLVNMYAKCGCNSRTAEVFDAVEVKDVLAWNTIITGMAMHGYAKEAQHMFTNTQKEGVAPNDIAFVAMFSAFRHSGMVVEDQNLLACMSTTYGIDLKVEHYGSLIDLLGGVSYLDFQNQPKKEDKTGLAEAITKSIMSTCLIDLQRKSFCEQFSCGNSCTLENNKKCLLVGRKETNIPFDKRMDIHSKISSLPHHIKIHWFSIINSCVTLLLLTGFPATLLMRVPKNDFVKYAYDEEAAEDQEEIGWKYIHGDALRQEIVGVVTKIGSNVQCFKVTVAIMFGKAFGLKVTVISSSPKKEPKAINHLGVAAFPVNSACS